MPITRTGWEGRIRAFADENGIDLGRSRTQRLALKIHQRAEQMQHVDPDDLLRSTLGYHDPTGETAVRRVLGELEHEPSHHSPAPPAAHTRPEEYS